MLIVQVVSNLRDTALIKRGDIVKRVKTRHLNLIDGHYEINSAIWNTAREVKYEPK